MPEPFALEEVRAFCDKHKLSGPTEHLGSGYINWVYSVGDQLIVRATKQGMDPCDSYTEAVAVPAVSATGIKTPNLLVFDDERDVLDSVVTVYERCEGYSLGSLNVDQRELPDLYRELGREVACLHSRVTHVDDPNGWLDTMFRHNLRPLIERAFKAHKIETVTYDWLSKWCDRLEPATCAEHQPKFIHNDMHAGNTMVTTGPLRLAAIIDWGDACWGDPAQDVVKSPVWAAPWCIEGYRSAGGTVEQEMIGRVLAQNIGIAIDALFDTWDEGDGPWQPMLSSFWSNLVRLMRMELPTEWQPWLPDSPI